MARWYQTLPVEGVEFEDTKRQHSKFWNDGKWDNFIKPLLPNERGTFLELGCNAGLFLKKATDAGYERVTGVEPKYMGQAEIYKKSIGYNYNLVKQTVGGNLDLDDLPLSDVTLMSNMHYYLPVSAFSKVIDDLKSHTSYCLLVGARARRRQGNAVWYRDAVRGYFSDWEEVGLIDNMEVGDDPTPRPHMYSVLFKGLLEPIFIDDIFAGIETANAHHRIRLRELGPALDDFLQRALDGEKINFRESPYYDFWKVKKPRASDEWIFKTMRQKEALAKDIQKNGMKTPVYYNSKGKCLDGLHRIWLAKLLGHNHVLARIV